MAFIITHDYIDTDAVGTIGPRSITETRVVRLRAGEGEEFRMLDDDNVLCYRGRILDARSDLQPLDCFGTPNVGCTQIQYRNSAGEFETING